jgi:glycine hydroxymethyltransferase
MIIAGASAYSRMIDFERFRAIADEVGAVVMADMAHIAGLVAAELHPSPIPYAHYTTSTTHKTLRGPRGGIIMSSEALGKNVDKAVFPGLQGGPLMHIIAGKAVAFGEALKPEFRQYQAQVIANAQAMAEAFTHNGIRIVSGGTDNHLLLLDLRTVGLTGKEADALLSRVGITVNKNTIPNDPQSPFVTSGIRLGTPAMTTRGYKQAEFVQVAEWIASLLKNPTSDVMVEDIQHKIHGLASQFPLYPESKQRMTV